MPGKRKIMPRKRTIAGHGTRLGTKAGRRVGPKAGKVLGKATWKAGKAEAKLARKALSSREPTKARLAKYALVAVAGFALGALLGRSKSNGASSDYTDTTGHHTPEPGSPAGQRGQTWGSGTPLGNAGGGSAGGSSVGAAATGPASTPLVGEENRPRADIATGKQQEAEQRVRTRIGEDPRTQAMPRVNVEVNDGIAELRGVAPTEAAKQAAGEIALQTEGVNEVRNLLAVS